MENKDFINAVRYSTDSLEVKRLAIRSEVKSNCFKFILLPLLAVGALLYNYSDAVGQIIRGFDYFPLFILIFLTIAYMAVLCSIFYWKGKRKFEKTYKDTLVAPLMVKLYPDLEYSQNEYLKKNIFVNSGLFTADFNIYKGDDYFQGKINNIAVEFSELNVKLSQKSSSSSSNNVSTIFSGLFLHATINKTIESRIIIDPIIIKDSLKLPGFVKNLMEKFLPNYGNVIKTGNNKFDEDFKLHCDNENEAAKIITPEFIAKVVEIKEKFWDMHTDSKLSYVNKYIPKGAMIKFSISGNSFYFALNGLELFKINFGKSTIEGKDELIKSLQYLNMLIDIVKLI